MWLQIKGEISHFALLWWVRSNSFLKIIDFLPTGSPIYQKILKGNVILSWIFALFGGFSVGYAFSTAALITSFNLFLKFIDYDLYEEKLNAHWSTFCAYTHPIIVVICLISLILAFIARFCAHPLCCIWSVKLVLLSFLMISIGELASTWIPFSFYFGKVVSGLGLGAANMEYQPRRSRRGEFRNTLVKGRNDRTQGERSFENLCYVMYRLATPN